MSTPLSGNVPQQTFTWLDPSYHVGLYLNTTSLGRLVLANNSEVTLLFATCHIAFLNLFIFVFALVFFN